MDKQSKACPACKWKLRDRGEFLTAAMAELAGDAHLSLEGDLKATHVHDLADSSSCETVALKRNTTWPEQDFVVLQLEPHLTKTIIASIGGTIPKGVLHIQIEKSGELELGLYDNAAPEASFFGRRLTDAFFERLEARGVITKLSV